MFAPAPVGVTLLAAALLYFHFYGNRKLAELESEGGEENVTKVEPIAETRVRVEVVDDSAVDVDALQRAGLTAAVQVAPGTWHLVAGLTAEQYAEGMRRRLVAT